MLRTWRARAAVGERPASDRHILYYHQQDARRNFSSDLADELDLSASTVRTRLNKLESSGIVRGYHIDIDYDLANEPRDISGVTAVREIMTGERNVYVNAIGKDHDDLNRITEDLDALGLDVVDEQLIRDEYVCPYHGFLDQEESES